MDEFFFIIANPSPICNTSRRFLSLDKAKTDCYNRINPGMTEFSTERHGLYNMKKALQMYTLRSHLNSKAEIADTLAKVRAMGYDGAEWYGLLGMTPEELAKLTTDAGLAMFSLHISAADLLEPDTDFLKRTAAVGVKYLPIGWLPEERLAGGPLFEETCDLIRRYAEIAAEYGLYVLYHNHDFDLAVIGDTTKLDALYDALPGNVLGAEPDTCWLYSGGVDPVEYLKRYADRAPVIHLKDCVKEGGRSGFCPVGMGVLDFAAILPVCDRADWVCVEQDEPSMGLDDFGCAEASVKSLLAFEK